MSKLSLDEFKRALNKGKHLTEELPDYAFPAVYWTLYKNKLKCYQVILSSKVRYKLMPETKNIIKSRAKNDLEFIENVLYKLYLKKDNMHLR